jgi:hypothetical protein
MDTDKKVTKKEIAKKLNLLIKQDRAEKAKLKHVKISFKENRFGPLVFAMLFAGVGCFLIFKSSAAPSPTTGANSTDSSATVMMWVEPATQQLKPNATLTAEVWIDSGSQEVNAVQAHLSYSPDKLDFVSIDSSTSAFSIEAESQGTNGQITVVRGTTKPLTGKQLVSKVTFRPHTRIGHGGQVKLNLTSESRVLSSTNNKDILSSRTSGVYDLTD